MIRITAFFILIAFVVQTCGNVFIVADYFINTTSYAKNCENKAKPAMHCNGKCQVMKKIRQQQNKDQQNSERRYENKNEVLSSRSFFPQLQILVISNSKNYPGINSSAITNRSLDIFHPPQASISI